jgi:hypothetical protein
MPWTSSVAPPPTAGSASGAIQGIYALDFQCCSQTLQMYKYFRLTASYFM